jgi:hypothetical protein
VTEDGDAPAWIFFDWARGLAVIHPGIAPLRFMAGPESTLSPFSGYCKAQRIYSSSGMNGCHALT